MGKANGAVANARELYHRDDTFRAGIAAWVEERRCDLRIVDVLLEHGLTAQAEGARWAATEPDRPFAEDTKRGPCGPFPSFCAGTFYWYDCENSGYPDESHDVPRERFGRQVNYQTDKFQSAADAILFLLDNWLVEPRPSKRRKRK